VILTAIHERQTVKTIVKKMVGVIKDFQSAIDSAQIAGVWARFECDFCMKGEHN
jgi:hypothetical protein